jgi:hypothetical protein
MPSLKIENPCSQNYASMQKTTHGAFCNSCQKQVIDFTTMSNQQILNYLANNKAGACVRIQNQQLNQLNLIIDANIIYTNIRPWKKFLAIVLICFSTFLIACNTTPKAKPVMPKANITLSFKKQLKVNLLDTPFKWDFTNIYSNRFLIGDIEIVASHTLGLMVWPIDTLAIDTPLLKVDTLQLDTANLQVNKNVLDTNLLKLNSLAQDTTINCIGYFIKPKTFILDSLQRKVDSLNKIGYF